MLGYVLEKTEIAWTTYLSASLTSSIAGLNIYRGMSVIDDKEGPAIIVFCPDCQEIMYGTGIYRTSAQISYSHPYVDSGSASSRESNLNKIKIAVLGNDNITNALSGSTNNFKVLDATFGGMSNGFQDYLTITTITIDMVVAEKE